ncbi:hypothetical protein D2E22_1998 [Bifidobacterium castoris]|uniref:Uncharacterized protein n=1 Tax=Bifidobacterium castoris TaxID=2306972 RepID=A0A430F4H6_9BIFI|nr:hypothetical protein D2E22_1998 [Bifidobacterium castoris]
MSREITNLCATPYGSRQTTYTWNVEKRQDARTGKWAYRCTPDSNFDGTFQFDMGYAPCKVGDVLVCIYSCDVPDRLCLPRNPTTQRIVNTDTTEGAALTERMGWVAGRISAASGAHELWILHECGWVTLEGCAVFSQEDWTVIRQLLADGVLTMPWFAPPKDAVSGPPVLIP